MPFLRLLNGWGSKGSASPALLRYPQRAASWRVLLLLPCPFRSPLVLSSPSWLLSRQKVLEVPCKPLGKEKDRCP